MPWKLSTGFTTRQKQATDHHHRHVAVLALCILIPICVIVILALLGPSVGNVFSNIIQNLPTPTP